jgi:hypothetical protein
MQSRLHLDRTKGIDIYDFLINPTDREYQRWWPGTHLKLHTVKQRLNNVGNIVYMDEFIGDYRVKMSGIVTEAVPGKKITWQLKSLIRMPVWLSLELEDDNAGVVVTHTIRAGFTGIGGILDTILGFYFTDGFEKAMDEHVRTEFPMLSELLLSADHSVS